jgi:hypothetical protein
MNLRWTFVAALLFAGASRAEDARPAADRPIRVRASHQVDVIAPGERVETVLDRTRAPPAQAAEGKPDDRPPVRGPDRGGPGVLLDHGHPGGARPAPSTGPPASGPPPDRRR